MRTVGAIIAARNAESTIGFAVSSALASNHVSEVIVVSDGSSDATIEAAEVAAAGDRRLRLMPLDRNVGPAAARNLAIDKAEADLLAVLDADDRFLPGRLEPLVEREDWDLVADNIVFVDNPNRPLPASVLDPGDNAFRTVSLVEFARGNLTRSGVSRGELGFLKPLLSREFLVRTGLRYDPRLRLGEDYDLYVRSLMAGGRFLLTLRPGYLAQVRADSLSSRHRTEDLTSLVDAMHAHLEVPGQTSEEITALRQVLKQMENRRAHRTILDIKGRQGLFGVLRGLLSRPGWIPPVAAGVLRDKLQPYRAEPFREGYRILLTERTLSA